MNPKLLDYLICPNCHNDKLDLHKSVEENQMVKEGSLFCLTCQKQYPISDFVLDLISNISAPQKEQADFFSQHDYDFVKSPFWRANDQNALSQFAKIIKSGWLIADIGCGPGRASLPLKDCGAEIIGFDVAHGLVKRAIEETAKQNLKDRYFYFVADAENIPLKSNILDAVLIYGVLHHVNDPLKPLKESHRLLKPQGFYFGHENNKTIFRRIFDFLMHLKKIWNEDAGTHPLFLIAELKELGQKAGLSLAIETSVFLPPHLFNLLGKLSTPVLRVTDAIFSKIPFFKNQGGVLIIIGRKNV